MLLLVLGHSMKTLTICVHAHELEVQVVVSCLTWALGTKL